MTRSFTILAIAMIAVGMALSIPIMVAGQASPPPFNNPSRNLKMPCAYCHDLHGGGTIMTQGVAQVEALCMSCHNGTFTDPVSGATAVEVAPHDNSRSSYGAWKVSCLGCHSPHRNNKAAGSEAANPPNGYGNWMLIGSRVPEANSTDLLARIRRPVIIDVAGDNNGSGNKRYEDDLMDGYFCSNDAEIESAANSGAVRSGGVVTITTITSHRFLLGSSVRIGSIADNSFNGGPFVMLPCRRPPPSRSRRPAPTRPAAVGSPRPASSTIRAALPIRRA